MGNPGSFCSLTRMHVFRMSSRSALLPWYSTTGQLGSHFLNSLTQLGTVANGAAMMKGPIRGRVRVRVRVRGGEERVSDG